MSKKLIEQLHPVGFATQAKRIEGLERANQHLIMALADAEALEIGTAERCDALQADNARLRESTELLLIARQIGHYRDEWDMLKEALAATPEQSLAEYRNKVIEDCAVKADALANCEENTDGYRNGAAWCAEAIRAMKEKP